MLNPLLLEIALHVVLCCLYKLTDPFSEYEVKYLSILSCLYEFDLPLAYFIVSCLIFWFPILEKCIENGQWPAVVSYSAFSDCLNVRQKKKVL